jgi:hypothetical protein
MGSGVALSLDFKLFGQTGQKALTGRRSSVLRAGPGSPQPACVVPACAVPPKKRKVKLKFRYIISQNVLLTAIVFILENTER